MLKPVVSPFSFPLIENLTLRFEPLHLNHTYIIKFMKLNVSDVIRSRHEEFNTFLRKLGQNKHIHTLRYKYLL